MIVSEAEKGGYRANATRGQKKIQAVILQRCMPKRFPIASYKLKHNLVSNLVRKVVRNRAQP